MANKRKQVIQTVEVEQIQLQGNWYTPVNERVKIAQTADPAVIRKQPGYKVISYQIVQMGERWGYCCMVEYPIDSGITMPGSDFIDMKDPAGLAKAETSAVGRALGFHGIASEDGIASADEMRRVLPREQEQQPQQPRLQAVKEPAAQQEGEQHDPPANAQQMASLQKLGAALKKDVPEGPLTFHQAGELIRLWSKQYNAQRQGGKSA